jgi:hypothetical protein
MYRRHVRECMYRRHVRECMYRRHVRECMYRRHVRELVSCCGRDLGAIVVNLQKLYREKMAKIIACLHCVTVGMRSGHQNVFKTVNVKKLKQLFPTLDKFLDPHYLACRERKQLL